MAIKNKLEFLKYVKTVSEEKQEEIDKLKKPGYDSLIEIEKEVKSIYERLIEEKKQLIEKINDEQAKSNLLTEDLKKEQELKKDRCTKLKVAIEQIQRQKSNLKGMFKGKQLERLKDQERQLTEEYDVAAKEYDEIKSIVGKETTALNEATRALDRCEKNMLGLKDYISRISSDNEPSSFIGENYPDIAKKHREAIAILRSAPYEDLSYFIDRLKNIEFEADAPEQKLPRFNLSKIDYVSANISPAKVDITFDTQGKVDWSIKGNYALVQQPICVASVVELFPESLESVPLPTIQAWPQKIFENFDKGLIPVVYERTADKQKFPTFEEWKKSMQEMKKLKEKQLSDFVILKQQEENQPS